MWTLLFWESHESLKSIFNAESSKGTIWTSWLTGAENPPPKASKPVFWTGADTYGGLYGAEGVEIGPVPKISSNGFETMVLLGCGGGWEKISGCCC